MALTDHEEFGTLRLSSPAAGGSCHSFGQSNGIGVETGGNRQSCHGVPLDTLVERGLPAPDHIKIDVDGFEHLVVAGAVKTLSNGVKSVLVEVNTNSRDHQFMVDRMESLGFTYDQNQVNQSIRKEGSFKGVSEYLFRKTHNVLVDLSHEGRRHIQTPVECSVLVSERLPFDVNELSDYLCPKFRNTRVSRNAHNPFEWQYIENVWPNYQELIDNLPENYDNISKSRSLKGYPQRFTAKPETPFWRDVFGELQNGHLKHELCDTFGVTEDPCDFDDECLLIRDFAGYKIGPHTDSPVKVITVLFYLAKDESMLTAGTSIYAPKKKGFTCKGGPHYPSNKFKLLQTMPYKPNTAFAFLKTDNSFHGVEPCTGTRDVLLYDIRRK
jgi:hypothetical protein